MPTLQEHIQDWAAALEEQAKIDEDDARKLADQPQADDAGQNAWRRLEAAVLERSARRYRALAGGSGQRMIRAGGCRRLAAPVARLADRAGRSPCRAAGGVFGAGGGSRRGLTCAVGCANLRLGLYSLHGVFAPLKTQKPPAGPRRLRCPQRHLEQSALCLYQFYQPSRRLQARFFA